MYGLAVHFQYPCYSCIPDKINFSLEKKIVQRLGTCIAGTLKTTSPISVSSGEDASIVFQNSKVLPLWFNLTSPICYNLRSVLILVAIVEVCKFVIL